MEFVAAVKHYQQTTDAMLIMFGAARVYKIFDAVVVDTITDDFIIGQYVSNVELHGFDLD